MNLIKLNLPFLCLILHLIIHSSFENLLKLKSLANEKLPQCKLWLLIPTLITDSNFDSDAVSESSITLNLNIDVIDNRNIKKQTS